MIISGESTSRGELLLKLNIPIFLRKTVVFIYLCTKFCRIFAEYLFRYADVTNIDKTF